MRCSAYEGCQQVCWVRVKVFLVETPIARRVTEWSGGARGSGGGSETYQPGAERGGGGRSLPSQSVFSLRQFFLWVRSASESVKLADRGRRVTCVGRKGPAPAPIRAGERISAHGVMRKVTATTGASAPSNPRMGLHPPAAATSRRRPVEKLFTLWLREI